jgi:membrane-bound lytic murein transglycosylase B
VTALEVEAHAVVATRNCKEPLCDREAEDARGRYAGLCAPHKRAKIDADRAERASRPREVRVIGTLALTAAAMQRQARRVDRASKKLEIERAELRRAYLRFGVEAGFLTPTTNSIPTRRGVLDHG